MSYLTTLTLGDAKTYLKVEHSDSDLEITGMIKAACSYFERLTRIMLYARDITYINGNDCARVYDGPINSVVKGLDGDGGDITLTSDDYKKEEKGLYSIFSSMDIDVKKLVLNVGYVNCWDMPEDIALLLKSMVKSFYYSHEAESIEDALPLHLKEMIHSHKRFII